MQPKFPFDVILEDIRSAHNVGAIFRTCDGAGVRKLYLCGITPYPPHNKIPKTALGAIDFVDWQREPNTIEFLQKLKSEGVILIAVEQTDQAKSFETIEYPENCALIFGNEISGVSPEALALADKHVEIPMFGQKNSLNIATTLGIMAYHVALQFAHQ